jgi:hypothetical protein
VIMPLLRDGKYYSATLARRPLIIPLTYPNAPFNLVRRGV